MNIKKLTNNTWRALASTAAAFCVAIFLAGGIHAQVTNIETFETGINEGAWTWGAGTDYIAESNGNPGRYLRESYLVTYTPRASTSFGVQSAFTGDYHERRVATVGIDLALASVSANVNGRTMTLVLLNDNGTPYNLSDDWGAYTVTDLPIPPTGVVGLTNASDILQWSSYDVPVPSQSATLPDGWTWIARNQVRRNGSWARLMRDVDHVGFNLGDPALRYPLIVWDAALDNPRITTVNTQ
jgi:hypothetical protein